jgi:hypothetical protein
MSFIKTIQNTVTFNSVKGLIGGLETVAVLTPTPFDNIAVATFKAILEALEKSNSREEVLAHLANTLPSDTAASNLSKLEAVGAA